VNAGLVADAGGNLAQVSRQIKMKEEDYMEVFNPWNWNVQLLERMLESQNSMQKLDVAEGDILKDIQEVWVEAMSTMIAREKIEENKQQFEELVDNNNNLKQRERGNSEW